MNHSAHTRAPLLFSKAVARTGSDEIPGAYCVERHVWMYDGAPLVTSISALAELQTKTDSTSERDDDDQARFVAELETKTKAQIEREDQDFSLGLLELMTKTNSQIERDD